MDSAGDAPRFGLFSLHRLTLLLGVFAVACLPAEALARGQGWHAEIGVAAHVVHGLGPMSGMFGQPVTGGPDLDLHIVKDAGGLGVRAVIGVTNLKGRQSDLLATVGESTFPVKCNLWQNVRAWSIGPTWSFPHGDGRWELHAAGGMVWSSRQVETIDNSDPFYPSSPPPSSAVGYPDRINSSPTAVFMTGCTWFGSRKRLWGVGLRLESGAELQLAGKGVFWDRPAFVQDGTRNVEKTRATPMSAVALRLGVNCLGWSGKR